MMPKIFNMFQPNQHVYSLLMENITCGFDYHTTKCDLLQEGYFLPEDMFNHLEAALNIQIKYDLGEKEYY